MKLDYGGEILAALERAAGEATSGEQLSQQLNISRTAIWKHIKKLQAQGYEISANSKLGYSLTYIPDKLELEKLSDIRLQDKSLSVHYFEQLESTQLEAKKLAELQAPEGTLVIAEQQTAGKGRLGRFWQSPYGKGIWMSLVLRPPIPLQFAPQLTLLIAVALCQTIRECYHIDAKIKWPNDLLIRGKKCSGILLESVAEEQRIKYIVAGIGINVNLRQEDFYDEVASLATSLRIEQATELNRTTFITHFYMKLDECLTLYYKYGFEPIAKLWESYADGFGQLKLIKQGDKQFEAIPFKLDESGALWVKDASGQAQKLYAAEIGEVRK